MTASLDITRLSLQERLDLIGELWDSLDNEAVTLMPEQEAELARRMIALDLEHDHLAWAKPYIDDAIAQAERGEAITLDEHDARMDALMTRLGAM